jgi:transcriptional regulator with XRE-family HTH domain
MCSVEIDTVAELGRRLRTKRTAAGRTIASVAADAGLSVPYIANLENGRGNPTVAALASLAQALGAHLRVHLDEDPASPPSPSLPDPLTQFAKLPRFRAEMARLSAITGQPLTATAETCLVAMATMAAAGNAALTELDCHRLLDTLVLLSHSPSTR